MQAHAVVLQLHSSIEFTEVTSMAVHMLLLAAPAVAGGFLQAFQLAFLIWPFNAALPLAGDLPRACITLRAIASFYAAGLRAYVTGARLLQARSMLQDDDDSSTGAVAVRTPREDAVAHARRLAFDNIY